MAAKALDLFKAYAESALPSDGGYIVSSFFSEGSAYTRYEVIAYPSVKALYLTDEGLTFQSDGNKLYVLVEPASYPRKFIEPFRRDDRERIPQRFAELNILTTRNQTRVMVSREPLLTYTSFTVFRPAGNDFAFVFLRLPDALDSLRSFFEQSLNREAGVAALEAAKAAEQVVQTVRRFTIFDIAPQQPRQAPAPLSAATPSKPAARKPAPRKPVKGKAARNAKSAAAAKAKAKAKTKAAARRKAGAPKAKAKAKTKAAARRKAGAPKAKGRATAPARPKARRRRR